MRQPSKARKNATELPGQLRVLYIVSYVPLVLVLACCRQLQACCCLVERAYTRYHAACLPACLPLRCSLFCFPRLPAPADPGLGGCLYRPPLFLLLLLRLFTPPSVTCSAPPGSHHSALFYLCSGESGGRSTSPLPLPLPPRPASPISLGRWCPA